MAVRPPRRKRARHAMIAAGCGAAGACLALTSLALITHSLLVFALGLAAALCGAIMAVGIMVDDPSRMLFDVEPELSEDNSVGYQPGR